MKQGGWIGLPAALACLALCATAQAQKMYRCGNAYQDRPCDGGQQGKVIGSAGAAQPPAGPVSDRECTQRGIDAQKIMWAKEAGHTAEMQLSASKSAREKMLISEVYSKRGSSSVVRAAIEADCVAEKEKAAQAAALISAAAKLQGMEPPAVSSAPGESAGAEPEAEAARQREKLAASDAARKKARCDGIASQLDIIRNEQRRGGSGVLMNDLNRKRQDAYREQNEAGCGK